MKTILALSRLFCAFTSPTFADRKEYQELREEIEILKQQQIIRP